MASVKICGVMDPDMAAHAMECGADWVGVVLVGISPRCVHADIRGDIAKAVGRDRVVALTINRSPEELAEIAADGFGIMQLHGNETPREIAAIRARLDLDAGDPVALWKARGVGKREDLDKFGGYWLADRLLVDAKPPEGSAQTGGHGVPFDWSLLEGWTAPKPWLLAGGLTPDNVAEAIRRTGATAVDVSSGVESARGVKDRALIRDFIQAAKAI